METFRRCLSHSDAGLVSIGVMQISSPAHLVGAQVIERPVYQLQCEAVTWSLLVLLALDLFGGSSEFYPVPQAWGWVASALAGGVLVAGSIAALHRYGATTFSLSRIGLALGGGVFGLGLAGLWLTGLSSWIAWALVILGGAAMATLPQRRMTRLVLQMDVGAA